MIVEIWRVSRNPHMISYGLLEVVTSVKRTDRLVKQKGR